MLHQSFRLFLLLLSEISLLSFHVGFSLVLPLACICSVKGQKNQPEPMQVKNATESDIYAQDIKKTGPFVNSPEFLI